MAIYILVNIDSYNGWLYDGTLLLPEPMLIYLQYGPVKFISEQLHNRHLSHKSLQLD